MTTRSANRTVLLDIEEDNGQATTATRSNRTRSHTSSTRSRAATTSSRSHSRRRPGEKKRVQSVATADFRGTNPVMDGDSEEEEQEPVERIPTLDERGHINFTNSRYKKSVDSAKRSVRARGALPAGSARSRDPFNPHEPVGRRHLTSRKTLRSRTNTKTSRTTAEGNFNDSKLRPSIPADAHGLESRVSSVVGHSVASRIRTGSYVWALQSPSCRLSCVV